MCHKMVVHFLLSTKTLFTFRAFERFLAGLAQILCFFDFFMGFFMFLQITFIVAYLPTFITFGWERVKECYTL